MINKKYLPSKKFLIALSIAVAIIILAIVLNFLKSNTTKYNNLSLNTTATSSFMEIDSDNDGLPDWKEVLYSTDPHKADTDGDGTTDLNEILSNRDPLKANTASKDQDPNDKVASAIIEQNQKILDDYNKLTDTEKFSRNLMSNIIASTPASGAIDQTSVNSLVDTSLKDIPQKQYSGVTKLENLTLLKTDETNLNANLTEYSGYIYNLTQKLVPYLLSNINIINSYISNNSKSSTSTKTDMLKLINIYQQIVNIYIKIPVPVAIGHYDINYHLAIINDLEKIIAIDKDITNSSNNSVGIFSNLASFNNTLNNMLLNFKTIYSVLKITN